MAAKKSTTKKKQNGLHIYIADKSDGGAVTRTNAELQRLAEKSGLSAEAIYRVARGDYHLRRDNAVALSKATGGVVPASEIAGLS